MKYQVCLVVQWLSLPASARTGFDRAALGRFHAAELLNLCVISTELNTLVPASANYWSLRASEPAAYSKASHHNEKPVHKRKNSPTAVKFRESLHSNKDPG